MIMLYKGPKDFFNPTDLDHQRSQDLIKSYGCSSKLHSQKNSTCFVSKLHAMFAFKRNFQFIFFVNFRDMSNRMVELVVTLANLYSKNKLRNQQYKVSNVQFEKICSLLNVKNRQPKYIPISSMNTYPKCDAKCLSAYHLSLWLSSSIQITDGH